MCAKVVEALKAETFPLTLPVKRCPELAAVRKFARDEKAKHVREVELDG